MNKRCPLCNSTDVLLGNQEEYVRCYDCGVLKTRYNYDPAQYGASYAKNYLEYAQNPINVPLQLFRVGLVSRWLKEKDNILDIGCCIGEFIRFAEKYYTCSGFEPNKLAADKARERVDLSEDSIYENLPSPKSGFRHNFQCVTLFDVLEHIQEPIPLLETIHELLASKGVIVITTPNVKATPFQGESLNSWKHYKPKEHLWIYSSYSLGLLLRGVGFELIHQGTEESDIRPDNPHGDIMTIVGRKRH